jgi:hypothetical protein
LLIRVDVAVIQAGAETTNTEIVDTETTETETAAAEDGGRDGKPNRRKGACG